MMCTADDSNVSTTGNVVNVRYNYSQADGNNSGSQYLNLDVASIGSFAKNNCTNRLRQ